MRILVDAMFLVYKTLYKMDWLHTSRGKPSGMEYGFLRTLQSMKQFGREIILCWDSRSIRYKWYEGYKKSRNNKPIESDRLNDFFELTKKVYPWSKHEGFEADDVIASLVQPGDWIHSRDKDMMQLITDDIAMLYQWQGSLNLWGKDYVYNKFGVMPCHMPMYQAFMGDCTDDVEGCKVSKGDLAWCITQNNGDLSKMLRDDVRMKGTDLLTMREFVESGGYERNLRLVTLIKDPGVIITPKAWDKQYVYDWLQEFEIFSLEICQEAGFMPEF